ncbi:phage tail protein [Enterobacter hormaechei]|uniref:phage tail-collar fiber domain-containing protein n=1 Tax=Enterobacter hormaechei TaxID=158836 RepID=UPI001F31E665|nr:phage tail protein [Enterobacter hormaechei]MCF2332699.1 phage tail protein [Enterobacter hormaechei]MCF2393923.1 phage tail protein [Enterobacter hormaechei]
MTVKYKTVITKAGAEKLAAATVPNGKKVNFTAMAVGDGGGTLPVPDPNQTKLVKEVWRHTLNKISQDRKNKNYVVAELLIPPETGGFWMRELGLYDDTGTLIAVGNMAESYKPALAEGSGRAQTVRMVIMVSDIESVELTIDTSTVMATQDYVDDKLAEHEQSRRHPDATLTAKGFTQLSSATDSTSEALAATPKAVKAAYDLAKGKYTAQDATTAQKGIVQLSSETDSTSEALAATPKAVKAANDNAAAANKNASERVSKSGDSMTGTLNQDSVAQATYNLTALSNAVTGKKNYLRKMRGGGTDTIWHETVQGGEYRLATGSTDAQEELAISTSAGVRTRGNFTSQTGGFYSGNAKKFSFVSSNTSDKNATLRLWGNADRPTVVELGDDTGYHLYSQRSKDGSLQFQYNGAGLFSGYLRAGGEVQSSSANSYRIAYGAFGTFWRNDGGSLYLMLTNKDDPWGNYNALRPFRVSLNNGEVIISKLNLSDFGYFDARYYTKAQSDAGYMPKTGAYTKAESDGRFQPKGNYTPAGQAYTKAESDARYGVVNGIRRGGQQIRNPTDAWFGNWESPAGCVVTGIQMDGRSDGRKLGVYFRQMQYLNKQTGAWVNIGD